MLADLIETTSDYRTGWRLPVYFGDEQRRSEKAAEYLEQIDDAVSQLGPDEIDIEACIDEYGDTGYELGNIEDLAETAFDDKSLEAASVEYSVGDGAGISVDYDRNTGVQNFEVTIEGGEQIRSTLEDELDIPFYRTGIERLLDIGRWLRR